MLGKLINGKDNNRVHPASSQPTTQKTSFQKASEFVTKRFAKFSMDSLWKSLGFTKSAQKLHKKEQILRDLNRENPNLADKLDPKKPIKPQLLKLLNNGTISSEKEIDLVRQYDEISSDNPILKGKNIKTTLDQWLNNDKPIKRQLIDLMKQGYISDKEQIELLNLIKKL